VLAVTGHKDVITKKTLKKLLGADASKISVRYCSVLTFEYVTYSIAMTNRSMR
jgi:hypothetical protein